jgi:GDPmannose 4,6-dehydratase
MKKALITGISGQDGSFLAEHLLNLNYEVHGIVRRHSVSENQSYRLNHIKDQLYLHYGDVTDQSSLLKTINSVIPDEIYNLAAQSHVRISFDMPSFTFDVNTMGFLNLLECVRIINPKIKIYQASSSEMFGNNMDQDGFQRITTPMSPVSPYGCSKLASHNLVHNYRNAYQMYIVSGILFNHESTRRGINFVTAKVANGAVKIKKGLEKELILGNLKASRDWGHSYDYVRAMHMMMQKDLPKDYIVSTGVSHTVEDLCKYVFKCLDLNYKDFVKTDVQYLRPEELNVLKGDSSIIKHELNWKPTYTLETMLDEMIRFFEAKYG